MIVYGCKVREENKRLMIFPVVSTDAHPHITRLPLFRNLSTILACLHFLAKIHTTHSLTQAGSVRVLTTESRQHTEVVSCNEKVQRVSRLGSF